MKNINEQFKNKIRWKIYNKEFDSIYNFEFSGFKFNFHIIEQKIKEEFADLICDTKNVMPWDVCNFFYTKNIKFSMEYRYIPEMSFNENLNLFKVFLYLQKENLRIKIVKFLQNYKIKFDVFDKTNNGKKRKEYLLQFLNIKIKTIYFIQWDSNIWLKPKKIYKDNDNSELVSYGWLFVQIGKAEFK